MKQDLLHRKPFFTIWWREVWIFVDNRPKDFQLSCCSSFGLIFFSFIQIAFGHAVSVSSFCLWLFIVNLINFYSVANIIACPKLFAWTHPKDDKNNLNKTSKLQLHEMSSQVYFSRSYTWNSLSLKHSILARNFN